MSKTPELEQAAQAFGAALNDTPAVQRYLKAQAALEADEEIYAQEQRMQVMYTDLASRQQAGEQLSRAEVDEYNALRQAVAANESIKSRDAALADVKALFSDAVSLLNASLGVDYTALVKH